MTIQLGDGRIMSDAVARTRADPNRSRREDELTNYIERLEDDCERYEAALRRIAEWSEAYPLEAGALRHVVERVGKIAKDALGDAQ